MPNDGDAREEGVASAQEATAHSGQETERRTNETSPDEELADTTSGDPTANRADDEVAANGPAPEVTIDQLEREIADLRDQLLRKSADFDNYRKRMQREKEEFAAFANRELLLDIVPIIDDFERAIKSGEESEDFTSFHDGIVMIEKQFTTMLERKWKLTRFDSSGEEFDPQRHEAMMTEQVPGQEHPVVLEDFQKGYLLNEKVLRPAKVKVGMPGGDAPSEPETETRDEA